MTIEEAINELNELTMYVEHAFTEEHKCKSFEALQMAIESLERQIPKKPEDIQTPLIRWGICPICKGLPEQLGSPQRIFNSENYCPNCGQAIDWEDQE